MWQVRSPACSRPAEPRVIRAPNVMVGRVSPARGARNSWRYGPQARGREAGDNMTAGTLLSARARVEVPHGAVDEPHLDLDVGETGRVQGRAQRRRLDGGGRSQGGDLEL